MKVAELLDDNGLFTCAMTCKAMRDIQQEVKPNTKLLAKGKRKIIRIKGIKRGEELPDNYALSGAWFKWAYRMMKQNKQSLKDRYIHIFASGKY